MRETERNTGAFRDLTIFSVFSALFVAAYIALEQLLSIVSFERNAAEVVSHFALLDGVAGNVRPEPEEKILFGSLVLLLGFSTLLIGNYANKIWDIWDKLDFPDFRYVALLSAFSILFYVDYSSIEPLTTSQPVTGSSQNKKTFLILFAIFFTSLSILHRQRNIIIISLVLIYVILYARQIPTTTYDGIISSTHYEVFAFPIVQAALGKWTFVDQLSQYGMYPMFIAPLWNYVKPSPYAITVLFAILFALTLIIITFVLYINSKRKSIVLVSWFVGISFSLTWYTFWPGDFYIQFFPVRLIFPSLVLLVAAYTVERSVWFWLLGYSIAWIGVYWNPESGVVALAIYGAFITVFHWNRSWLEFFKFVSFQIGILMGSGGVVFLLVNFAYLIVAGVSPNWNEAFFHLTLFSSGFNAIEMPFMGFWLIIFLVYGFALFKCFHISSSENLEIAEKRNAAILAAFSVWGIMFLFYYVNRSHPLMLAWVAFPAFVCIGLIIDAYLCRKPSERQDGVEGIWISGMAAAAFTAMGIYLHVYSVPYRSWEILAQHDEEFLLDKRVANAFARLEQERGGADEIALFLTPYATVAQVVAGTPHPLGVAGLCQLWHKNEVRQLEAVLNDPDTRVVVLDASVSCPIGDIVWNGQFGGAVRSILSNQYQLVEESPENSPSYRVLIRR